MAGLAAAGLAAVSGCGKGGKAAPPVPVVTERAPDREERKLGGGQEREETLRVPGQDRLLPSQDPRNQPREAAAPDAGAGSAAGTEVTLTPQPPATAASAESSAGSLAPPQVPRGEVRYRVQLMATLRAGAAYELHAELKEILDLPVYVEFEQGLHKLRVGDFRARGEADDARRRLVGLGYADAFVVEFRGP